MMRALLLAALGALALGCPGQKQDSPSEPAQPEVTPPDPIIEQAAPGESTTGAAPLPQAQMVEPLQLPPLSATTCVRFDPAGQQNISSVSAVVVCTEILGANAGRKVAVEFFTPRGMPYERREVSLFGSGFEKERVEFSLPVSGTMIDTSRMSGQWTAKFFLDGAPLAAQTFDLSL